MEIPVHFWAVAYNGKNYPGAPLSNGLQNGANCQHFVFELLRYYGYHIPPFRSSELWDDTQYSQKVQELAPMDVLLWNYEPKAWGAHIGLYLGNNKAIHLARFVGKPVIWPLEKFAEQEVYAHFIGAKRFHKPNSETK